MAFQHIDLVDAHCFGWSAPREMSWQTLAEKSVTLGWKQIDSERIESELAKNVVESYRKIAGFTLADADTGIKWVLSFINEKALWSLSILDSPGAEPTDEDRDQFYKCEMFKKICRRCSDLIDMASKTYNEIIASHIEKGDLLQVDEVKLSAILHWLKTDIFVSNLKQGKYML